MWGFVLLVRERREGGREEDGCGGEESCGGLGWEDKIGNLGFIDRLY